MHVKSIWKWKITIIDDDVFLRNYNIVIYYDDNDSDLHTVSNNLVLFRLADIY